MQLAKKAAAAKGSHKPIKVAKLRTPKKSWGAAVFLLCLIAYLWNGDFDPGMDQQGNMLFSVNLVKHHSFSLTPAQAPRAFRWSHHEAGEQPRPVDLSEWNAQLHEAYRNGALQPQQRYYLTPTRHQDRYVNTFGMGAPLVGAPLYALLNLFVDIDSNHYWWWYGSKLSASLLIAAAALFLFLGAACLVAPWPAFLISIAFALGSCVWTTSSQALWQHPANTFFLALGAYFLCGMATHRRFALYCGAALGMAVLCRPPSAVVVVCVGLYLLIVQRRWLAQYVLGGAPVALALAGYNWHYFGELFYFGQIAASQSIALQKTGLEAVWQTPIFVGLGGLLFSPSRGLLFYSPVLLFGFAGAVLAWRNALAWRNMLAWRNVLAWRSTLAGGDTHFAPILPLSAALLGLLVVASRWFDWWGGYAYGYRPIVDSSVLLALCMAPIMGRVLDTAWLRHLFTVLLCWSIGVQMLGAFSYNGHGWNYRNQQNIDQRQHQHRLWSLRDQQIRYYLANFRRSRSQKHQQMNGFITSSMPIVVHPPLE